MLVEAPLTSRDYLALDGLVVSGHVRRNVTRVQLGAATAYLKREHCVRWRDRWRNWRAGFGWVSLAQREATVLRYLHAHGIPVPQPLACGEADGQAFLAVAAVPDMVELHHAALPAGFGVVLGAILARLHAAGVDQPDLFAKHILVNPETHLCVLIDWQRALLRSSVTVAQRVRALAALRATAFDTEPPAWWPTLLATYQQAAPMIRGGALATRIDALATTLRQRPNIRSQRQTLAHVDQTLVRIAGETVCTLPALAATLRTPEWLAAVYDPRRAGPFACAGRRGLLHVTHERGPLARWWHQLRGKVWRSDNLRTARLLFHLERHGLPAPALLAYGQQTTLLHAASFVWYEPRATQPLTNTDPADVLRFVDALHAANCLTLGPGALGVQQGRVVVADPMQVRLVKRLSGAHQRRQRAQWLAWLGAHG